MVAMPLVRTMEMPIDKKIDVAIVQNLRVSTLRAMLMIAGMAGAIVAFSAIAGISR